MFVWVLGNSGSIGQNLQNELSVQRPVLPEFVIYTNLIAYYLKTKSVQKKIISIAPYRPEMTRSVAKGLISSLQND